MRLNIISDIRLIERQQPLLKEMERQGIIEYTLWPIIHDPESVIASISKSHKQIVQWAKDQDLPEVAIAEDDLFFPAPDGWKRFLEDTPPMPFDLYLGGTYGLNKPITGIIERINGLHLYIIRKRFYDAFLSVPEDKHIDVALDQMGVYYVEYPFVALQRAGWSSNSRAFSDKNADLLPEDIYQ